MASRKRKADRPTLPTPIITAAAPDSVAAVTATTSSAGVTEPPSKRARQVGNVGSVRSASINHASHADEFACEQAVPLRTFLFDLSASGPAGQQASLERQGWNGSSRERVALHCPFDNCHAFIVVFVAASSTLAPTYQQRLCGHQFAANRGCAAKWARHCGIGETDSGKQRAYRCAHQRGGAVAEPVASASIRPPGPAHVTPSSVSKVAATTSVTVAAGHGAEFHDGASNEIELLSEFEDDSDSKSEPEHATAESVTAQETKYSTPAPTLRLPSQKPSAVAGAPSPSKAVVGPTVTSVLPSTLTLTQLVTPQPDLVIKDGGRVATDKLVALIRPLLPPQMGEVEPLERDEGLASLQEDIIQRMQASALQHCQVSPTTYETSSHHCVYRASKTDVMRFATSIARGSSWLQKTKEATKSLSEWMAKMPGGKYNNVDRVEALVLAIVQVLYPSYSSTLLRHPDEDQSTNYFNAHKY